MSIVSAVLFVVALLVVAYLFAQIAAYAGIPVPAAVTLVGIAAGGIFPQAHEIELNNLMLALFLPPLIFESAWDMHWESLVRVRGAVLSLAIVGVFVTTIVIAVAARASATIDWTAALVLGTILAATDPVAVLALFRKMSLPVDLVTIVEGESIGNDAVALGLLQLIVPIAAVGITVASAATSALVLVYIAFAGLAIGVAIAYIAARLLSIAGAAIVSIPVTIVVAYGSYLAATTVGASGIFAVAAAGIALRRMTLPAVEDEIADRIERFWDLTALLANSVVFLLVGLAIQLDRIFHEPVLLALTVVGAVAARALLAYGLVRMRSFEGYTFGWHHTIALSGLRGGLSIAMVLELPHDFPSRPAIIDAVFAVVFLTLVVQGWAIEPIVRRVIKRPLPRTVAAP